MLPKFALPLLLCAGLLAACAGPPAQTTPLPIEVIDVLTEPPTEPPSPTQPEPTEVDTPMPDTVTPPPTSEFAPQPGDEALTRGNLFIEDYGVKPAEGAPAQLLLSLSGSRPTPCHAPRVVVGPPDANNRISVEAYSVQDPDIACIQVLRPFAVEVPLGTYPPGDYTVVINDEFKTEFTV